MLEDTPRQMRRAIAQNATKGRTPPRASNSTRVQLRCEGPSSRKHGRTRGYIAYNMWLPTLALLVTTTFAATDDFGGDNIGTPFDPERGLKLKLNYSYIYTDVDMCADWLAQIYEQVTGKNAAQVRRLLEKLGKGDTDMEAQLKAKDFPVTFKKAIFTWDGLKLPINRWVRITRK